MSSLRHDRAQRRDHKEEPTSSEAGGWTSTIWGVAVIAGFIGIQTFRHFSGTDGGANSAQPQPHETKAVTADFRRALLEEGITVNLVIHSCRDEYAGPPHGDLNLTKQATDIESIVSIGGQTKTRRSRSENQLPNPDAGEVARCRLVFNDEGMVFLNTHERAGVGGTEVLDISASYELEVIEGSRTDFDAGRPIRLAYTPDSLEKRREALRNSLALQWLPMLRREVPGDSTMNFKMKCVVEPLPQSVMTATPSSLSIEDGGPVKAVITVAVSER